MLERLSRQFDVVLVDSSGTLSDVSQAVLEVSSLVLWVTTSDMGFPLCWAICPNKAKTAKPAKTENPQLISAVK